MILLDAYALIAFVGDELAAPDVEALLQSESCGVTAVNLAEMFYALTRVRGHSEGDVADAWKSLQEVGVVVVEVGEGTARGAAALRAKHYHGKTCPVSLADCIALAAAAEMPAEIATSDAPMVDVARAEGIAVRPLPSTSGLLP